MNNLLPFKLKAAKQPPACDKVWACGNCGEQLFYICLRGVIECAECEGIVENVAVTSEKV